MLSACGRTSPLYAIEPITRDTSPGTAANERSKRNGDEELSLLWAGDTSERGLRWNAVGSLSAAWPHWYLASEWPSAPSRSGASHPNQLRRSTVRPAPRLRLLHLCGTIQYCERHYCICFPAIQYWCSVSRDQRPARDAASHCDHAAALQVTAAPTPTLVITSAPLSPHQPLQHIRQLIYQFRQRGQLPRSRGLKLRRDFAIKRTLTTTR